MVKSRRVQDIDSSFFNDGHWYTLTSQSLGGMSPDALSEELDDGTGEKIHHLMKQGVCLPLAFDADCAMDLYTRFVVGDLSEREEAEWIGRVQASLHIPDGQFTLIAGGMPEHFEDVVNNEGDGFVTVEVEPGDYLLEVYAYLGSYTVNMHFEHPDDYDTEDPAKAPSAVFLKSWWRQSRGDTPEPAWLAQWQEESYVDNDDCEFLAYVVRLKKTTEPVPPPAQDKDYCWWVTAFEFRELPLCPQGIPFKTRR